MSLAVRFFEYGGNDNLRMADVPPPVPGPGQVRVAVKAAGVNPLDWKILRGYVQQFMPLELPAGLGSDVAGVVDAVGDGVTGFAVGDEVLGSAGVGGGSFAQHAVANAALLVARPAGVPWEVAGSLAGAGATAWKTLDVLDLAEGQTLLIHAAAGGVGTVAVQLAAARGIRVIGTAGAANHDRLRSLGAVPVSYGDGLADRVRAVSPDGVDAVLDASGRGELAVSVELTGDPKRVLTLAAADAVQYGVQQLVGGAGPDLPRALRDILDLITDGRLQVPISRTYPLSETAAALDASEAGHLYGKIVLLPR